MPVLACLVCPACMSLYAKVFAALGVGVVLSERAHGWILATAVTLSIATSAMHARRTKRVAPLAITLGGATLVVSGHSAETHWIEWMGVLVLLVSGLLELSLIHISPVAKVFVSRCTESLRLVARRNFTTGLNIEYECGAVADTPNPPYAPGTGQTTGLVCGVDDSLPPYAPRPTGDAGAFADSGL